MNILRNKPRKRGLDLGKACSESMAWMHITQAMRDSGRYACSRCGRVFVLGAGERAHPSTSRRVPTHLAKKAATAT